MRALWRRHLLPLRSEFAQAVLISMLINTLMVLPSLYMLQVYDRVMVSQNGMTLLALTLVLALGLLLAAWLEQGRTAVLVRMGQRMDGLLASLVHEAALQRELQHLILPMR